VLDFCRLNSVAVKSHSRCDRRVDFHRHSCLFPRLSSTGGLAPNSGSQIGFPDPNYPDQNKPGAAEDP
jgi:hypothetical protein